MPLLITFSLVLTFAVNRWQDRRHLKQKSVETCTLKAVATPLYINEVCNVDEFTRVPRAKRD